MGGLDWNALPVILDIFGIEDVETYVRQLTAIRDHQAEMNRHG